MILLDQYKGLESTIRESSSLKEIAMYHYVLGDRLEYPQDASMSDIERVCMSAYCTNAPPNTEAALRIRETRPIKGMHYSNNVIELCAMYLCMPDTERANLNAFSKKCSLKELFMINAIVGENIAYDRSSVSDVDKLVECMIDTNKNYSYELIFDALKSASDLMDIYIIKMFIIEFAKNHDIYEYENDLVYMARQLRNMKETIESDISMYVNLIIVASLLLFLALISVLAIKFWDDFEPVYTILSLAFVIMGFVVTLIFSRQDVYNWILSAKQRWSSNKLRRLGVSPDRIENLVSKYPVGTTDDRLSRML